MSDTDRLALMLATTDLPEAGARALSKHGDEDVRRAVAQGANTPQDALALLARDRSYRVAGAALSRVSDSSLLDPTGAPRWMRRAMAQNPHTAPEVLEDLARRDERTVTGVALTNLSLPVEVALDVVRERGLHQVLGDHGVRAGLRVGLVLEARPEFLDVVSQSFFHGSTSGARVVAARHPDLGEEVAERLMRRGEGPWTGALAGNPYLDMPVDAFTGKARAVRERLLAALEGDDPARLATGSEEDQLRAAKVQSHTLDLLVSRNAFVSASVVRCMLGRAKGFTRVRPDTLVRLVERGGTGVEKAVCRSLGDHDAYELAAYSVRLERFLSDTPPLERSGGPLRRAADELLGDDPNAWEALVVLGRDWAGSPMSLLQTAGRL